MKRYRAKDKINDNVVVETRWHDSRVKYVTEVRQTTTWAGPRGRMIQTLYGDTQDEAEQNHSAGILTAAGELA
jgi:hypothetical protein